MCSLWTLFGVIGLCMSCVLAWQTVRDVTRFEGIFTGDERIPIKATGSTARKGKALLHFGMVGGHVLGRRRINRMLKLWSMTSRPRLMEDHVSPRRPDRATRHLHICSAQSLLVNYYYVTHPVVVAYLLSKFVAYEIAATSFVCAYRAAAPS